MITAMFLPVSCAVFFVLPLYIIIMSNTGHGHRDRKNTTWVQFHWHILVLHNLDTDSIQNRISWWIAPHSKTKAWMQEWAKVFWILIIEGPDWYDPAGGDICWVWQVLGVRVWQILAVPRWMGWRFNTEYWVIVGCLRIWLKDLNICQKKKIFLG